MVLPLKLFADCFPRDHSNFVTDNRILKDGTELGHSQPLAGEEKGRGPHFGMGMGCLPSVRARTISGPNNLHSKLRATIHLKKRKKKKKEAVAR